ncbi:hypothetical protein D3C76_1240350 [compost metagenome]
MIAGPTSVRPLSEARCISPARKPRSSKTTSTRPFFRSISGSGGVLYSRMVATLPNWSWMNLLYTVPETMPITLPFSLLRSSSTAGVSSSGLPRRCRVPLPRSMPLDCRAMKVAGALVYGREKSMTFLRASLIARASITTSNLPACRPGIRPSQSWATILHWICMRSQSTLAISGSKPSKLPSGRVRFQGS